MLWNLGIKKPYFFSSFVTGFDVNDLSENAIDDNEGLDASAAYVASLLATEPSHSKFLSPVILTSVPIFESPTSVKCMASPMKQLLLASDNFDTLSDKAMT